MSINRIVRVNELLRREIADELVKQLDRTDINPATVMITRVETSPNLKTADVFISVIGSKQEQHKALRAVEKMRPDLQHEINKVSKLKYTPRLNLQLDHSIAEGDHVLGLIAEMEEEHPEWNREEQDEEYGRDD